MADANCAAVPCVLVVLAYPDRHRSTHDESLPYLPYLATLPHSSSLLSVLGITSNIVAMRCIMGYIKYPVIMLCSGANKEL
jgi:hypothetical protein